MTEQEIFEKLKGLVRGVLVVKPEEITMQKTLIGDLGAQSIDLLDLSFLIEDNFGITIAPNEFETDVKKALPGGVYEKDGLLTEEALIELRKRLPEIDQSRLTKGFRKAELPTVLTIGVFVHLIQRKMAENKGTDHA